MKIYLVGGKVRDNLLGVKSNDMDYVMVLDDISVTPEEGFKTMESYMIEKGFKIFLSVPEMYVIRAKFPENHKNKGLTADFSLSRKELGYEPDSRRPKLVLGTLEDDLLRRDFTVNAMAEDEDGNIIDPFNGRKDLKRMVLETPLPSLITFNDDPLRLIRSLRFNITKGFTLSSEIERAMDNEGVINKFKAVVSQERVREELEKMFKHDTIKTIQLLSRVSQALIPEILEICFSNGMWLKPTTKAK